MARLVAHRLAEEGADIRKGVGIATFAGAVVGLGAAILTAVPLGGLPEKRLHWMPVFVAGALVGAAAGAAVGILVSMRQRRFGK